MAVLFRFSAIRPSAMDCSNKEVHLIVILNDIHSDDVSLGDAHCKAHWSNGTHAEFHADIDNCSLVKKYFLSGEIGRGKLQKIISFS